MPQKVDRNAGAEVQDRQRRSVEEDSRQGREEVDLDSYSIEDQFPYWSAPPSLSNTHQRELLAEANCATVTAPMSEQQGLLEQPALQRNVPSELGDSFKIALLREMSPGRVQGNIPPAEMGGMTQAPHEFQRSQMPLGALHNAPVLRQEEEQARARMDMLQPRRQQLPPEHMSNSLLYAPGPVSNTPLRSPQVAPPGFNPADYGYDLNPGMSTAGYWTAPGRPDTSAGLIELLNEMSAQLPQRRLANYMPDPGQGASSMMMDPGFQAMQQRPMSMSDMEEQQRHAMPEVQQCRTMPESTAMPDGSAMPSKGSAGHYTNECKPCLFWFYGPCIKEERCTFCHLNHDEKEIRRMRPSKATRNMVRRRQVTET